MLLTRTTTTAASLISSSFLCILYLERYEFCSNLLPDTLATAGLIEWTCEAQKKMKLAWAVSKPFTKQRGSSLLGALEPYY